jgi:hypothetical protein
MISRAGIALISCAAAQGASKIVISMYAGILSRYALNKEHRLWFAPLIREAEPKCLAQAVEIPKL